MRLLIAGSRSVDDFDLVVRAVNASGFHPTSIISGGAPGTDTLAERYAHVYGLPFQEFPAAWDDLTAPGAVIAVNRYGKPYNRNAGKDRNEVMGEVCDAGVLLNAGNSPGTRHMRSVLDRLKKPYYMLNL